MTIEEERRDEVRYAGCCDEVSGDEEEVELVAETMRAPRISKVRAVSTTMQENEGSTRILIHP